MRLHGPRYTTAREMQLQADEKSAVFSTPAAAPRWTRKADQGAAGGLDLAAASTCWKRNRPSHNNPMLSMENVTLTAMSLRLGTFRPKARKRRVGYELSLVLQGNVAGKLRQSVGAARTPRSAAGNPSAWIAGLTAKTTRIVFDGRFTGDSTPGTRKNRE